MPGSTGIYLTDITGNLMRGLKHFLPLLAVLLTAATALSQVTSATFYGTISDPAGGVVPGASVTMLDEATGSTIARPAALRANLCLTSCTWGRIRFASKRQGSRDTRRPGYNSRPPRMCGAHSRWDLSLGKNFPVTERARLQLRADAFDFLNHTNFTGLSTSLNSPTFGRFTSTRGVRVIQLNARISF